jgi:hypothetical protein
MNTRKFSLLLLQLTLPPLMLLGPNAFATPNNEKTFTFASDVSLNGTMLPAGYYDIRWVSHSPEATVTFAKGGHVVATSMGKWEDRGAKYKADAVVYTNNGDGSHTLREIRFAGQKQVLVLGPAAESAKVNAK